MLKELSNHAPVSINGFTIVSNFLEIISFVKRNKWIVPEFSVGEFLLNYFFCTSLLHPERQLPSY